MAKDLTTDSTESTEGATPETDANASDIIGFYSCATVPAGFARRLERQRDEWYFKAHANASFTFEARSELERWREIAARLALACIADGGDFREEVLRDYRKMLEEAGE